MDNLIKTYDDILDSQTCKNVIDKFEQFETQHESFDVRGMVFTQLNMAKSPQIWSKEIEQFTSIFESSLLTYLKIQVLPHNKCQPNISGSLFV